MDGIYAIQEFEGCRIIWGMVPLRDMKHILKLGSGKCFANSKLADEIGASLVFGTKENLDKMAAADVLPTSPLK